MNNICKVVWSHVHQQFVVVSEIASTLGKAKSTRVVSASGAPGTSAIQANIRTLCMAVACAVLAPAAWAQTAALPAGGQVVAGQGSIQTQGSVMTVNQASQRMALDWQSFNIGAGQTVNFVQPNAQATALNRVLGSDVSTIQGQINANGRVYLLNPNGILFTPSAQVNVGGLVASTLGMSTADFMAGNDRLAGDSTSAVTNQGQIRTAQGGTVALVAARVTNVGEISAPSGSALLAAGRKVRLDLGGPTQIEVEEGALNALIEQSGSIRAADGMVYLTAKAASQLSVSAINQSGLIEAGSIDANGGLVVLEADHIRLGSGSRIDATGAKGGGTVLVGGDWQGSGSLRQATAVTMESGSVIDASALDKGNGGKVVLWSDVHNANSVTTASGAIYAKGGSQGGDGGQIETSGAKLNTAAIQVDASAQVSQGKAGLWLIDPSDYVIDSTAATNIVNALNAGASGTNVEVTTQADAANYGSTGSGTGNITVSSEINATSAAGLSLTADGSVTLNAPVSVGGNVSITTTGLSGTGGIALGDNKSLTVNQSGDSTYSGVVSGTNASLVKQGTGTLTLSADHTYTGSTTISAGTLQVGNGGATGSLATSNVVNNGNLVFYTGSDKAIPYVISGTGSVEVKGGEYTIFNNYLTTGNQTIATGTTVLDVLERIAGGLQGGLYINCVAGTCGTIPAGAYNKKYDPSTNTATFQIQTYFYGGPTNQFTKVVFVKLSASGSNVVVSSYGGRVVSGQARYAVYKAGNHLGTDFSDLSVTDVNGFNLATSIDGSGYGVAQLYASTKTQFTAANTYTGQTTISNTVAASTSYGLNGGATATYSRVTSGILELVGAGSISDTSAVVNNGVLIFNRSDDVAFNKDISGTGNVVKNNTNTVTYTGAGTYTGITYVNDGTLSVGDGGTAGSLTSNINNKANVTFNRSNDLTYAGIVSGTGTLTKEGGGDLTLTGNQTYTGATAISAGQLVLSNNAPTKGTSTFAGPGQLVIQSAGDDFSADFSTSGWTFDSTLGGLTIGKSASSADGTADKNVTVNSAINVAGPVSLYGGNVAINAALTASSVTLKGSGAVSQTGAITANDLLLLGGNVTLDHASNNVSTLAASSVGSIKYWDSNTLTIGTVSGTNGITATGAVDVQTLSGNLAVAKNVVTTDATSSAVILNAGRSRDVSSAAPAVGADTAGNILIGDAVSIATGANGRVVLYTGSIDNSTGVDTAAGSGNLRYGSDETTTRFNTATAPLGSSGTFAIYRERPSLGGTYLYGESLPQGITVNNPVMTGNYLNVGSYTMASGGNSNLADLGYSSGVTVTARPITITANSGQTKVYGESDPVLTYTKEANGTGRGLMDGDVFTGALSRGPGENVGNSYAITQGTLANGNYTITFNGANFAITPRPINITVNSGQSKVYGNADPALTYTLEANSAGRGLVNGDTFSGALARAAGANVGNSYAITQGTLANSNYSINFTGGNFAVTPRPITVTIDSKNKTYGDSDPTLSYSISSGNLIGSDVLTLNRVTGENVGNYAITAANSNYAVTANSANLTIGPRALSLLIDSKNKRSGDADPAWTYQLLNGSLLFGDELTLSRLAGEAPGKYLISAANPNYQITAADAYLNVANRIESPTLVNGLLTVAPVQPAAQTTSSPALSVPQAGAMAPVAPASPSNPMQVSSGLMMIPVAADQAKVLETAAAPSSDKASGSTGPAAAGWLQSAQALGYTGVLVVEGGVRLPEGVR